MTVSFFGVTGPLWSIVRRRERGRAGKRQEILAGHSSNRNFCPPLSDRCLTIDTVIGGKSKSAFSVLENSWWSKITTEGLPLEFSFVVFSFFPPFFFFLEYSRCSKGSENEWKGRGAPLDDRWKFYPSAGNISSRRCFSFSRLTRGR